MKKLSFLAIILALSLGLSQCYYFKEGLVLLDLYHTARPIPELLASDTLSIEERTLLELSQEIKEFAVARLGLAFNSNYTTYIRLERNYLALVVTASAKLAFEQYYWDYPFVGRLPYKGFFRPEDAEAEASRLAQDGFDVWVRPVDAFSTLGVLSDPIFSFMKDYSVVSLAEIIIHEQAHATVFLKDQASFNENFASFVGKEGMKEFLKVKYGAASKQYQLALFLVEDQHTFDQKLKGLYAELQKVYQSAVDPLGKLKQKLETIARWQEEYRLNYDQAFKTQAYKGFASEEINNAWILGYLTYNESLAEMERLYDCVGRDLKVFISFARQLSPKTPNPLLELQRLIEASLRFKG